MNIKHPICITLLTAAAIVVVTVPASAGWLETLVSPAAYEEIPAPEAIHPPIQNYPADIAPPEMSYEVQPNYEAYSPIYAPVPAYHAAHGKCCEKPKVIYRNHPILALLLHKCKTGQAGPVVVEVPTGCCPTEVTLCLPICCTTCPPEMTKARDLLGRCVYQYCWPCGTKVNIVQRYTGDLVVHSYEL